MLAPSFNVVYFDVSTDNWRYVDWDLFSLLFLLVLVKGKLIVSACSREG